MFVRVDVCVHARSDYFQAICVIFVLAFQKAGHYESNTTTHGGGLHNASASTSTAGPTSNTGGWCWIEKQDFVWQTILWELMGGKFIEIVSTLFLCPVMYFLTLRNLAEIQASRRSVSDSLQKLNKDSQTRITEFGRKLHFVPVIFLLARMWGTINAAVVVATNEPVVWLEYMVAIFDPSQGFWNGLMCVRDYCVRDNVCVIMCA